MKNDVIEPETVASHMYRMSIMSMLLPAEGIDRVRCVAGVSPRRISPPIDSEALPY